MQIISEFPDPLAGSKSSLPIEEQRQQCAQWTLKWLKLKKDTVTKPAVVFDIDATLLNKEARIESICALYQACRAMRIACFIVTARDAVYREKTMETLKKLDLLHFKHMYMMEVGEAKVTATYVAASKLRSRDKIHRHGYCIILNVGDAWHDHAMPKDTVDMKTRLPANQTFVYITPDGVAHLKLPE